MAGSISPSRKLAESVRFKLLQQANKILDGEDENAKKELLFKMCNSLLPRLNEHTGADGKDLLPSPLLNGKSNDSSNLSNPEATSSQEEN